MIVLIGSIMLLMCFVFGANLIRSYRRRTHGNANLEDRGWRGSGAGSGELYPSRIGVDRFPRFPTEKKNLDAILLKAARRNGGRLTLSDIVIETGMGIKQSEQYMDKLSDGMHVSIEIDPSGRLWYVFPELRATDDASDKDQ